MFKPQLFNLTLFTAVAVATTGCSDAKTTLIERAPLAGDADEYDHDAEHGGLGRLVVVNATGPEAMV